MIKANLSAIATMLLVACGCNEQTPGGPGVRTGDATQSQTTNKPVVGDSKETFVLQPPMLGASLKQGEAKATSVAIRRGTNFDGDVQLKFSNVPAGVTIDPISPVIKHGEKESKIRFVADEDASVGDFTLKVEGHPLQGGADATSEFKMTVSAK